MSGLGKKLLAYKCANSIGDILYYFVITIVVFDINQSVFVMSLLSLSYLASGIIGSSVLKKWILENNPKKVLLTSDIIRVVSITSMIFTNIWQILLLLVFIEQFFSISSSASFNYILANTASKSDIKKINYLVVFFVNAVRIGSIVGYTMIARFTNINKYFLGLNAMLTLLAISIVLFSFPIIKRENPNLNNVVSKKTHLENKIDQKIKLYILSFCLMASVRIFGDSYFINYSNEIWGTGVLSFSAFSIMMVIASIVATIVFSKTKDNKVQRGKWMIIGLSSLLFVTIAVMSFYQLLAIISLFFVNFLINYQEIELTTSIAINCKDKADHYMLKQAFYYNINATLIAGLGLFITSPSLIFRIVLIPTVLALIPILLLKKGEDIDKSRNSVAN